MKRLFRLAALCAPLLLATACAREDHDQPVEASMIGSESAAFFTAATTQGLVRHDGSGQIEPGLAIRWAISSDGLYYTFRLADTERGNANLVAQRLRAAIASDRNPLKPHLGAIDEVVAVTPEVVEIRLKAARPNLLDLLAQPEMGIMIAGGGTGPFRIARRTGGMVELAPIGPELTSDTGEASEQDHVRLHSERPAIAILAFMDGRRDVVLGGRFVDFPLATAARVRSRDLRVDPVEGLFGLAIETKTGFLGRVENRRALAMSVDRPALLAAFRAPDWGESISLVPTGTLELPAPILPDWALLKPGEAQGRARETMIPARANEATALRIALPRGPGAKLLYYRLRSDWAPLGISLIPVASTARADLRLIDEVAPSQSASWYLRRHACGRSAVCSSAADRAMDRARDAQDPAERTARLAEADTRLTELVPFIPLARPLRWSLVSPRLGGFQTNNRATHPLNHLLPASD